MRDLRLFSKSAGIFLATCALVLTGSFVASAEERDVDSDSGAPEWATNCEAMTHQASPSASTEEVRGLADSKPSAHPGQGKGLENKGPHESQGPRGHGSEAKAEASGKKCDAYAERQARKAFKDALKDSGISWGRERSSEAHAKVAARWAERIDFMPETAKAQVLVQMMAKVGADLPEGFDYSTLFPEDFEFDKVEAYIASLLED